MTVTMNNIVDHFNRTQRVAHLGSWEWDIASGKVIWSDEHFRILGIEPGSVDPTYDYFFQRVHPADHELVKRAISATFDRQQPYACEFRVVRQEDGRIRHVIGQGDLERDAQGQPLRMTGTMLDITERKEAEAALHQSNERLQFVLEATGDAIWDADLASGIVSHNLRWCELLGLTDEYRTHPVEYFYSLIHPEDQERLHAVFDVAMFETGEYKAEFRLRKADGSYLWVSDHGRVARRDANGKPLRIVGALSDITARKTLETELEASRKRLELALGGSNLGLWDCDVPSGQVVCDQRWLDMVGYRLEDMQTSLSFWESLIHPDDKSAVREAVAAHLRGDTARYQSEHRLRHQEGHWVWCYASGKIMERDPEGKPLRVVGTVQDISAQKRLANEGSDLLQRIQALLKDSSSAYAGQHGAPDSGKPPLHENLTRRQRQILELIAKGLTSPEIASRLGVALGTIVTHRRELMRRLDLHSASEVTRYALEHRLIPNQKATSGR